MNKKLSHHERNKHDPVYKAKRLAYQQEWRDKHPGHWKKSYYKAKLENPERYLLKQAKKRSADKGHKFSLVLEDIVIPEKCPIMGVPMKYVAGEYSDYSPSIDRIDSTKGYTKDNIQIISSIANRMKWNSTKEQLILFAKGVLDLYC